MQDSITFGPTWYTDDDDVGDNHVAYDHDDDRGSDILDNEDVPAANVIMATLWTSHGHHRDNVIVIILSTSHKTHLLTRYRARVKGAEMLWRFSHFSSQTQLNLCFGSWLNPKLPPFVLIPPQFLSPPSFITTNVFPTRERGSRNSRTTCWRLPAKAFATTSSIPTLPLVQCHPLMCAATGALVCCAPLLSHSLWCREKFSSSRRVMRRVVTVRLFPRPTRQKEKACHVMRSVVSPAAEALAWIESWSLFSDLQSWPPVVLGVKPPISFPPPTRQWERRLVSFSVCHRKCCLWQKSFNEGGSWLLSQWLDVFISCSVHWNPAIIYERTTATLSSGIQNHSGVAVA